MRRCRFALSLNVGRSALSVIFLSRLLPSALWLLLRLRLPLQSHDAPGQFGVRRVEDPQVERLHGLLAERLVGCPFANILTSTQ